MKTSTAFACVVALACLVAGTSAFEYVMRPDGTLKVPLARRRHSAEYFRVMAAKRAFYTPKRVAGGPPIILQKDFQDSEYYGTVSIGTPPQVRMAATRHAVVCVHTQLTHAHTHNAAPTDVHGDL